MELDLISLLLWLTANWDLVLAVPVTFFAFLAAVVKATPTESDDAWWAHWSGKLGIVEGKGVKGFKFPLVPAKRVQK